MAYCAQKSITPTTTWRTLTGGDSSEWGYLVGTRSASTVNNTEDAKYMMCKVNSISGLLLFPDSFTWPTVSGAPAESTATAINSAEEWDDVPTYTLAEFATFEAAGCVFLPAGGFNATLGVAYTF